MAWSDFLIGAPGKKPLLRFSGGRLATSPYKDRNGRNYNSFGYAVAGGEDLMADGKPDFVVGSPMLENSQGGVFVFKGSNGKLLTLPEHSHTPEVCQSWRLSRCY